MKMFFRIILRAYQLTISPIFSSLGCGCRFHPSCSEYSKDAFKKYGVMKAIYVSAARVARCNALNPGGFDPA